jgi:hypothetical protein
MSKEAIEIREELSKLEGLADYLADLGDNESAEIIDGVTIALRNLIFPTLTVVKEYKDGHRIVKKKDKYGWQRFDKFEHDYIPFEDDLEFPFISKAEAQDDYKGTVENEKLWNL